jgi:hypothetical protein
MVSIEGEPKDDRKYVTIKRAELHKFFDEEMVGIFETFELQDAVVIRRQDMFASPALATYAACISMVAKATDNIKLMGIADYFQRQSELAADEGWKLPDV